MDSQPPSSYETPDETLNTRKCLVYTCGVVASGVCDGCANKIIKLVLLRKANTVQQILDLIIESPRYLPSVAQGNPGHPYTRLFYNKVLDIIKSRSEFIVENHRIWNAVEWIKEKLDKKAFGVVLYTDMPAMLGCTAENVYHFKLSMYRGIEGYMSIGTTAIRKHTKYNCYSASRLMQLLIREDYRGVPVSELYQDDPNIHTIIKALGNQVVIVNQRVYRCHATPTYASHFEKKIYHLK